MPETIGSTWMWVGFGPFVGVATLVVFLLHRCQSDAAVAVSDIDFAGDSILAIFAIASDAFIVLASNIFAILGLRALYLVLADLAGRFHLLSYGLAVFLRFAGVKMLLIDLWKFPVHRSLATVGAMLAAGTVAATRPARRARGLMNNKTHLTRKTS